jgi:hypothetical protein
MYLGEGYVQGKEYNHRSILRNEIVIEFDEKSVDTNRELIEIVSKRLKADNISHSIWFSGNKSFHLHTFVNTRKASNIALLKRVIVRHYTADISAIPDMRLTAETHLIRLEHGIHEQTKVAKSLVYNGRDCYVDNNLPESIWNRYQNAMVGNVKRETTNLVKTKDCPCLKHLSNVVEFRKDEDGRERALFVLIHTFKDEKTEEELGEFLCDWYKYSGGFKLSPQQIKNKVRYHYKREYGTFTMIRELMESLGKKDVLESCELHGGKRE